MEDFIKKHTTLPTKFIKDHLPLFILYNCKTYILTGIPVKIL